MDGANDDEDLQDGLQEIFHAFELLSHQNATPEDDDIDEKALSNAWDLVTSGARRLAAMPLNVEMNDEDLVVQAMLQTSLIVCIREGLARGISEKELLMKCLNTCCALCSIGAATQDLLAAGVVRSLAQLVRDRSDTDISFNALECLNNLAVFPSARSALIAEGVPPMCETLLAEDSSLYDNAESHLVLSLRTFGLLCKLYGKDEDGPGADILFRNLSVSAASRE
jgi:hypothetical protein